MSEIKLTIDPNTVLNSVDEMIYGQFLEHIYHAANGGLWGELIWNRSFEERPHRWYPEGDLFIQQTLTMESGVTMFFGDQAWDNYEISFKARRTEGFRGFMVLFRAQSDAEYYCYKIGEDKIGHYEHYLQKFSKDDTTGKRLGEPYVMPMLTGQWYQVRVRCEGDHFRIWIDGQLALDYTDDENPYLLGKVGLGSWWVIAEFADIQVKTLDGQALFVGTPPQPDDGMVSRYWKQYGSGNASMTQDEPLNNDWCVRLVSRGQEAGILQKNINLQKGQIYKGSLWARTEDSNRLAVRFINHEQVLKEKLIDIDSNQWTCYDFELKANQDTPDSIIKIGVMDKGQVWLDQVQLMSQESINSGGFRPDLLKAVSDLKPTLIRWPGGFFAEFYRWKDGIGSQHKRVKYPLNIWEDQDTNSLGTDEFIQLCKKVGAEPVIVINLGRHDAAGYDAYVQEARDWIEYCNAPVTSKWGKVRAENGHPQPYNVKYWEIDNETWGMGIDAYIEAIRQFVPAMKAVDPSIRIIVCGSANYDQNPKLKPWGMAWNRQLLSACPELFDVLSIHHYEDPQKFAEGPYLYEAFFRKIKDYIDQSANPQIKVFVSEWNAMSTDWRTGLYAGGILNAFERCGNFLTMASPALFMRHVSATGWNNALINFDHKGWFPAPNYQVMNLWREHYAPYRIHLSDPPEFLNAVAAKSEDGNTIFLKLVNTNQESVSLRLDLGGSFKTEIGTFKCISSDDLDRENSLENATMLKMQSHEVNVDGGTLTFKVPGWSAGVLSIQKCPQEQSPISPKIARKNAETLSIEPIPPASPDENQYIGFKLKADWMDGYLRVRFPENVISDMGWHFLDNLQPEIKRVSDVKVPEWTIDKNSGRLSYRVQTPERIGFAGVANVVGTAVELEFVIENNTAKPQDIHAQVCLDLSPSGNFNERIVTKTTFACYDDISSFDKLTSPKAKDRFAKIGYNWILMLYGDGPHDDLYELEKECMWWIVDQKADLPLIWRLSRDQKHLVAMTWGSRNVRRLMTNTNIPCLHTDPLEVKKLSPGERAVWQGRIYLMENDTKKLMKLFNDFDKSVSVAP